MLNTSGSSFDFGNVVFAVLQECEHRRRGFVPAEAPQRLMDVAREKLAAIEKSYRELGGGDSYWRAVEREVLQTAMPQYIGQAVEKSRMEKTAYDVWRQGDLLARASFAAAGLIAGGLAVAAPFIPIWIDAFSFTLAGAGWFYPELKRFFFETKHANLLNGIITDAERYQKNPKLHYLSSDEIEEALRLPGESTLETPVASTSGDSASESVDRNHRLLHRAEQRER